MRTASLISVVLALAMGPGQLAWGQQTDSSQKAAPPAAKATGLSGNRDAPETIMFTIDEINELRSRAAASANEGGESARSGGIENATLFLSTILYSGPQEWTIWVNGVPIGPGQDFQAFRITDIGPNYAELVVPLSAQGMRPVRLSPNQSFISASGSIVEGKWS